MKLFQLKSNINNNGNQVHSMHQYQHHLEGDAKNHLQSCIFILNIHIQVKWSNFRTKHQHPYFSIIMIMISGHEIKGIRLFLLFGLNFLNSELYYCITSLSTVLLHSLLYYFILYCKVHSHSLKLIKFQTIQFQMIQYHVFENRKKWKGKINEKKELKKEINSMKYCDVKSVNDPFGSFSDFVFSFKSIDLTFSIRSLIHSFVDWNTKSVLVSVSLLPIFIPNNSTEFPLNSNCCFIMFFSWWFIKVDLKGFVSCFCKYNQHEHSKVKQSTAKT